MAEIAVVILNFNGEKFLSKFLPGVLEYSKEAVIYVVDNYSTDQSVPILEADFPSVKLICFDKNHGFTKGYNLALKQIDAKYFVLLNSDIEVTENWISPIIKFMNADSNVAACQPKIKAYHHKDHFEYAGAAGGFLDILGYPYCRGRLFESLEIDEGQYDSIERVFWASGACLFIRADVFNEQQGFTEDFFAHMEEIDLCWRINLTGRSIYCIPESTVYHVGGGTLSKSNPKKTYLNFRNNMAMLYINSSIGSLLWKLPAKFLFDWIAAFKFWKDNSSDHFNAVLMAQVDFLKNIRSNKKRRDRVRNYAKKKAVKPPLKYFVPFQYFVLGKRKFSEL